jgi:hypothetical protein
MLTNFAIRLGQGSAMMIVAPASTKIDGYALKVRIGAREGLPYSVPVAGSAAGDYLAFQRPTLSTVAVIMSWMDGRETVPR